MTVKLVCGRWDNGDWHEEVTLVSLGSGPWLVEHRAQRSRWVLDRRRVTPDTTIPEVAEDRAQRDLHLRCPEGKHTWRGRYDDVLACLTTAATRDIASVPLRSLPV
jgi:hypothetical protein